MNKKLLLSLSLASLGFSISDDAIEDLPPVQEFGVDNKRKIKFKKKAEREAKRREKRLAKLLSKK